MSAQNPDKRAEAPRFFAGTHRQATLAYYPCRRCHQCASSNELYAVLDDIGTVCRCFHDLELAAPSHGEGVRAMLHMHRERRLAPAPYNEWPADPRWVALRHIATERNRRGGWATPTYKANFGGFPLRSWKNDQTATPSAAILRWAESRMIAYATARAVL
jgi:hypothetical protein